MSASVSTSPTWYLLTRGFVYLTPRGAALFRAQLYKELPRAGGRERGRLRRQRQPILAAQEPSERATRAAAHGHARRGRRHPVNRARLPPIRNANRSRARVDDVSLGGRPDAVARRDRRYSARPVPLCGPLASRARNANARARDWERPAA
ncbi:hypothetical protein MRX96_002469 [Rhipicephalus microplus]